MGNPEYVWLLWHGDDIHDETPDAKLLGVYSTEDLAHERIERSARVSGFRDHPAVFEVARYEIDRDEWTEGFVRIDPDRWVAEGFGSSSPDPD